MHSNIKLEDFSSVLRRASIYDTEGVFEPLEEEKKSSNVKTKKKKRKEITLIFLFLLFFKNRHSKKPTDIYKTLKYIYFLKLFSEKLNDFIFQNRCHQSFTNILAMSVYKHSFR